MAIKPTAQLTVTSSTPVKLNVDSESDYRSGSSLLITTSGPLHYGGTSAVTNSGANRGSLHPAVTVWPVRLDPGEDLYVIAPSGQTVTVEVLQGGV